MENIPTDTYTINVTQENPLTFTIATARFFVENDKERIGIKEKVIEEIDTRNCLTGEWKTSLTPDGFYVCAHKDLYKDFENVFDFNTKYGCQINNPIMLLDQNGQPDKEFMTEADKTGASSDYIDSCKYIQLGKFQTTFIFASANKTGKIMKNKKAASFVMDACRNPRLGPRMFIDKNTIGYNCYYWKDSEITIIETHFGDVIGFLLREYVPKKKRSNFEEMMGQRFGDDDGKVFHFE